MAGGKNSAGGVCNASVSGSESHQLLMIQCSQCLIWLAKPLPNTMHNLEQSTEG